MITVAMVRTGDKYPAAYMAKLAAGVRKHLAADHEILCLADRPDDVPAGIGVWDVSGYGLTGWWAKMLLFHHAIPARGDRILYFDLDTLIVGDLAPLAAYDGPFGICANFTRRAGIVTWPCNYGSCVMSFPTGSLHKDVWLRFRARQDEMMAEAGAYGDQWSIEMLRPGADMLQALMPAQYFAHFKRDLNRQPPAPETSVVVFGGTPKPHEVTAPWYAERWAAA